MVLFHEIFFVGVLPVDVLDRLPQVVIFRVVEKSLGHAWNFNTCFTMVICRKYFSEGVSHPQFPVECPAHVGLPFVETAISHCMLGGWRKGIVAVVTEKLALILKCGLASATHLDGVSHTGLIARCIGPLVRRLLH